MFSKEEFLKSLKHKLIKQTGILLSGDAIARLLSLASLTITVRTLGAEGFGIIALAETYAKLVDRIFNFQAWTGIIRFGAQAIENKDYETLGIYIRIGFILDLISSVIGFIIAFLAVPIVAHFLKWDYLLGSSVKLYSILVLFNFTGTAIGILRLTEQFSFLAWQRLAYGIIKLSGVSIVWLLGGGLKLFILVWSISEVISYFIIVVKAYAVSKNEGWLKKGKLSKTTSLKPFISFTICSNLSSTVDIPIKFLDIFIVSSLVSVEAAGIYKTFQQISHVLRKPVEPLYQVIYPYLSTKVAKGSPFSAINSSLRATLFMTPMVVLGVGMLIISAPFWLPRIFGEIFRDFVVEFSVYMIVVGFSVLSANISPLFMALGFTAKNFFIQAFSNLTFIFLAWVGGTYLGLNGIIMAYGVHVLLVSSLKIAFIFLAFQKPSEKEVQP